MTFREAYEAFLEQGGYGTLFKMVAFLGGIYFTAYRISIIMF